MDYEEIMLQISDVMREANRVRPDIYHEQAVKKIQEIVTPKGKWVQGCICQKCYKTPWYERSCIESGYDYCPFCGADMRGDKNDI